MQNTTSFTSKNKYNEIKSYCKKKYENDRFDVSYMKLCLEILFPDFLNFNSVDSIEDAIEGLGSRDLGVDAYIRDDKAKTLIFCQFKTSDSEKNIAIDPRDISYFNQLPQRLAETEHHENSRVRQICSDYRECLNKNYRMEFYFITSYNLSKEPVERLKENFQILTLDDIYDKYKTYRSEISIDELDECVITLCQNEGEKDIPYYVLALPFGKRKTVVGIINGCDIISLYKENRKNLFARNVRYFLGNRGINKNMIKTAKDTPEFFYSYNNGITITCDSFDKCGKNSFRLKKPQIINGAQTVCSIYDAYEEKCKDLGGEDFAKKHFTKLYIMARIIETTKGDNSNFAKNVTKYNNTQNKILEQDFYANDTIQKELKEKLKKLGYFYENKRNEFETLTATEKKEYQNSVIKLGDITPLYCCFKYQDNSAGSHKKDLFEDQKFHEIFNDDCITNKEVANIVFVYNMHKILKDIKRQLTDYEKGKETLAKEQYCLSVTSNHIVSQKYLDTLLNQNNEEKEKAERIMAEFDAIKQPYVMIAIISEILKRYDFDMDKYKSDHLLYEIIQKEWLGNIANIVYDIYMSEKAIGDNIINYYKSKNLIRDFKDYLDTQEIRKDKTVKDIFPLGL